MSNIQARAPTEAVIPKYVQPKTILSLDVPSDLKPSSPVIQAAYQPLIRKYIRERVIGSDFADIQA